MENKWIAHERNRKESKINMVCIPYAGASANIYGKWKNICPVEYNVLPMLFPMRETRIMEEMPKNVKGMAEMFVAEAKEIFEKPVLLFGHCTGAILAYEIALAAEEMLGKKVVGIVASSANEPGEVPKETKELMNAPNKQLIEYLRKEELVEEEMLEDEDFCDYYLPILKADFKIYGTYKQETKKQLDCPIITIYDKEDSKISERTVDAWAEYTTGEYRSYQVKGGHYYMENPKQIMQIMEKFMDKYMISKQGGDL